MNIPELVYAKWGLKKDGVIPDPVFVHKIESGAAATVSAVAITVPDEFDLILSSFSVQGSGGLGQSVSHLYIAIQDLTGIYSHLAGNVFAGDRQKEWLNWSGNVWIPEGFEVSGVGFFTGGGESNQTDAHLQGILIPKLNV